VKSKSKGNNASTEMLRVRYAELQSYESKSSNLRAATLGGLGEPRNGSQRQ
jgi:hypothetical protein